MRKMKWACGVLVLLIGAAPAAAQDVGPFYELTQLIEAGDDVRVTFRGGRERRKVRVTGLTPTTLSVLDRGVQRDLAEDDVWFIYQRVSDSTRNGAWIGFAAGAACAVWWHHSWCSTEGCTAPGASSMLLGGLSGMVGLWIGVGVDALNKNQREEEVYPRRSRPRMSVAPLLLSDRRGVAVSLSF